MDEKVIFSASFDPNQIKTEVDALKKSLEGIKASITVDHLKGSVTETKKAVRAAFKPENFAAIKLPFEAKIGTLNDTKKQIREAFKDIDDIELGVDTSSFITKLAEAEAKIKAFNELKIELNDSQVTVTIDGESAKSQIEEIRSELEALKKTSFTIPDPKKVKVGINQKFWGEEVGRARGKLALLDAYQVDIKTEIDLEPVYAALNQLEELGKKIPIEIQLIQENVDQDIDNILKKLNSLESSTIDITLGELPDLEEIKSKLNLTSTILFQEENLSQIQEKVNELNSFSVSLGGTVDLDEAMTQKIEGIAELVKSLPKSKTIALKLNDKSIQEGIKNALDLLAGLQEHVVDIDFVANPQTEEIDKKLEELSTKLKAIGDVKVEILPGTEGYNQLLEQIKRIEDNTDTKIDITTNITGFEEVTAKIQELVTTEDIKIKVIFDAEGHSNSLEQIQQLKNIDDVEVKLSSDDSNYQKILGQVEQLRAIDGVKIEIIPDTEGQAVVNAQIEQLRAINDIKIEVIANIRDFEQVFGQIQQLREVEDIKIKVSFDNQGFQQTLEQIEKINKLSDDEAENAKINIIINSVGYEQVLEQIQRIKEIEDIHIKVDIEAAQKSIEGLIASVKEIDLTLPLILDKKKFNSQVASTKKTLTDLTSLFDNLNKTISLELDPEVFTQIKDVETQINALAKKRELELAPKKKTRKKQEVAKTTVEKTALVLKVDYSEFDLAISSMKASIDELKVFKFKEVDPIVVIANTTDADKKLDSLLAKIKTIKDSKFDFTARIR